MEELQKTRQMELTKTEEALAEERMKILLTSLNVDKAYREAAKIFRMHSAIAHAKKMKKRSQNKLFSFGID